MNKDFQADLVEKLGTETLGRISAVKIGIAGAGGLGSNCAASLVRVGFRRLKIVDFDRVEASNLDRQFFFEDQIGLPKTEALRKNLLRINSELELHTEEIRLDEDNVKAIFGDCGIVAECLDRPESKSMLISGLHPLGIPVVSVSGLGGIGSSDEITIHRIHPKLVVIGDLRSDVAQRPALSPRVLVAAAKQADVILEYVTGPR